VPRMRTGKLAVSTPGTTCLEASASAAAVRRI
jgi:hypothetical protein